MAMPYSFEPTYICVVRLWYTYVLYCVCMDYGSTGSGVLEFSRGGGSKLDRLLPKNQHTQRKLRIRLMGRCQKFGIILENKLI